MRCSPGKYLRDCCSQSHWQCCIQTDWEARASPAGGRGLLGASYWGRQEAVQTDRQYNSVTTYRHPQLHRIKQRCHKNKWAGLKNGSHSYSSQFAELMERQAHLLCPRTYWIFWLSKLTSLDQGSGRVTEKVLLRQRTKLQHTSAITASKSSTESPNTAVHPNHTMPNKTLGAGWGSVPTCNIKDASLRGQPPSLQPSVRVQPQHAHYPPPLP